MQAEVTVTRAGYLHGLTACVVAPSAVCMAKQPRKITLAQAVRQGDTTITFYCVAQRKTPSPVSTVVNVCGHRGSLPIAEMIARYGQETRLDQLPAVCSVCGGREIEVRAERTAARGQRWISG